MASLPPQGYPQDPPGTAHFFTVLDRNLLLHHEPAREDEACVWQHTELTEEVSVDKAHPRGVLDHLVLDNDTGACIPPAKMRVLVVSAEIAAAAAEPVLLCCEARAGDASAACGTPPADCWDTRPAWAPPCGARRVSTEPGAPSIEPVLSCCETRVSDASVACATPPVDGWDTRPVSARPCDARRATAEPGAPVTEPQLLCCEARASDVSVACTSPAGGWDTGPAWALPCNARRASPEPGAPATKPGLLCCET